MRQKHLIATVVGGLILASVGVAEASLITFKYSGEVTSISDPNHALTGLVSLHDSFEILYTFDSTTPDSASNPTIGAYISPNASLTGAVGHVQMSGHGEPISIQVVNSIYRDTYSIGGALDSTDIHIDEFGLTLADSSASVFSSDALPLVPPDLTRFDGRILGLSGQKAGVGQFNINGGVAQLILVPEPSTGFLICIVSVLSGCRWIPSAALRRLA